MSTTKPGYTSASEIFGWALCLIGAIHLFFSLMPHDEHLGIYSGFSKDNAVGATANATRHIADRDVLPFHWIIAGALFIISGKLSRTIAWHEYLAAVMNRPQPSPPPVKVPLQEMLNNPEWDPGKAVIPPVVRK